MRNTIYATFSDPKMAEKAAGALLDHGFSPKDLSIIQSHKWRHLNAEELAPEGTPAMVYLVPNSFGVSTGIAPLVLPVAEESRSAESLQVMDAPKDLKSQAEHGISTTTPADASAGAKKGLAWGVGVGAVAALAALFIPGIGLVVGGGALATAIGGLAGSAGAGAAAGALTGYLKDQGIESHVLATYEHAVNSGGAVLGATLPSGGVEEDMAWEVLNKYAGQNVTSYLNRPYMS